MDHLNIVNNIKANVIHQAKSRKGANKEPLSYGIWWRTGIDFLSCKEKDDDEMPRMKINYSDA
jgi:hypothetical protein